MLENYLPQKIQPKGGIISMITLPYEYRVFDDKSKKILLPTPPNVPRERPFTDDLEKRRVLKRKRGQGTPIKKRGFGEPSNKRRKIQNEQLEIMVKKTQEKLYDLKDIVMSVLNSGGLYLRRQDVSTLYKRFNDDHGIVLKEPDYDLDTYVFRMFSLFQISIFDSPKIQKLMVKSVQEKLDDLKNLVKSVLKSGGIYVKISDDNAVYTRFLKHGICLESENAFDTERFKMLSLN